MVNLSTQNKMSFLLLLRIENSLLAPLGGKHIVGYVELQ